MVLIVAVVILLPLAVAAPSGADDAKELRGLIQDALAAGLPGAPQWLLELPLIGPTLFNLWNSWAADLTVMVSFFKPYSASSPRPGCRCCSGSPTAC